MNKISQEEIATLFPNGLPPGLVKVVFPELSTPLTPDEMRFIMQAVAFQIANDRTYMIGPRTLERVFEAAGLVNMSDLQAVMDAVERALTSQGVQDAEESAKEFAASARAMKQLADHGPDDDLRDAMREMSHRMFRVLAGLSPSAIPAAPAKQDVIKPLEWDRGNAKWIFGTFDIQQDSDGSWMLFQFFTDENDDLKITEHPTREAAEQAAQALHNAELVIYLSG